MREGREVSEGGTRDECICLRFYETEFSQMGEVRRLSGGLWIRRVKGCKSFWGHIETWQQTLTIGTGVRNGLMDGLELGEAISANEQR